MIRIKRSAPCSIKGPLERRHLKAAAQNVIARHEILRTTFHCLHEMTIPMQVIEETVGIAWQEDNVNGLDDRGSLIEKYFHETSHPFDIEQGPLLHFRLIEMAKKDYVLILRLPAIYADSVSLRNLVGELSRSYAAVNCGDVLNGAVAQYADLAEWQNELIESEETRAGREYWRDRILPRQPMPQLAFEGGPAIDVSFKPHLDKLMIAPPLTARIESIARSRETSPGQVLLACWQILLWRYTGRSEVEVGAAFDGRRVEEIEDALGLFAKYLPVTSHLEERLEFRELLEHLDRSLRTAQDWQEYFSWEQIAGSPSNAPGEPYFPFCFEPEPGPASFLAGVISFTIFKQYACIDRFKIKLSYARRADGLVIEFHYSSELFRPADIRSLIGHYHALLENVVTNPFAKIGALEMLTDAERQQILAEYNSTKIACPQEKFAHDLISEQARRSPEAVAVIYEWDRVTYYELNDRAARLANYLQGLGIGPEVVVGLCMERSLDLVVSLLAILKAGGAYLPLDPSYPQARLSFMLEDAGVKALLTHTHLRSRLPQSGHMRVIDVCAQWDLISQISAPECKPMLSPDNLAYVIYTSGSTGKPKGVMLRHGSLANYLLWAIDHYPLEAGCGAPVHSSLSFDLTITSLFTPLLVGGCVHLVSTENEIEALVRVLNGRPGYSLVKLTPAHLQLLAGLLKDGDLDGAAHSLVIGGENLPSKIVRWWRERAARTRLFNEYGPTESVVGCCVYESGSHPEAEEGRPITPIGRPIANTSLYLLDQRGELSPKGVVGELCVGGEGLARGYLNRPELTAESFRPSPYSEEAGARLYRTGDLARYLRGGQVECLGRMDGQVKIRGYRVELGEIEAHLTGHPAVREAVVVAREDHSGAKVLVAYYTPAGGSGDKVLVDAETLWRHLSSVLPEHMTPTAYEMLEALPLNSNGKLDRRALPAPGGKAYVAREYVAPVGAIETALARIWSDLLQVERVGRQDNFFALGGHSLLMVILIKRMRNEGLHADVRAFFASPTLAVLAETVSRESGVVEFPPNLIPPGCQEITPEMLPLAQLSAAEIERIVSKVPGGAANVQDIYPMAPLQEGILFHYLLETEGDPYLGYGLYRFDSRSQLEKFLQALQSVIDRHDILRTAVQWEGLSEPMQVVWRRAPLIVEEIHFDSGAGDVSGQLRARFDPRRYRLDISQAPMMRAYIAPDGLNGDGRERQWAMLLLFQHLSIDHVTVEILLEEIQAHLLDRAEQLPAPLPFRNFVAQARLSVSREEHERFFREMLGDVDEPTTPFGLTDAQGDGSGIEEAGIELDAGLSRRLRERARSLGVSAASLCHLAWAMVLARVAGQGDVVFGTVLLGRMQGGEGAVRTLGLFINTLPMRIRVNEEGVERSARRVHRLLAELIGHEHASLALAQKCSGVEAPAPLFNSLLNYRHSQRETNADEEAVRAWTGVKTLASEERTNYPLMLLIEDLGEGLALTTQSVAVVDPRRVNELMRTALERLAEALEIAPEMAVRAIDIMPEAERRQVVEEWNATKADYPKKRLIHELFEEQAEKNPHAVALVYEERSLSYGELNVSANRLAWRLRELGVGPEARVAICLERGLEMVIAMLATLKAGGAYAPLDPAYPSERLAYMLEDSEPVVLLTHGATRSALAAHTLGLCAVDLDTDASQWAGYSEVDPENAGAGLNAQRLAYILYTSGSTGLPKGVAIEHRSVVNFICWAKSAFNADALERTLFSTSINFDLAVYELFVPLAVGATATIVGNALDLVQSPAEVTLVNTVPSAMKSLVDTKGVPKSVRTVNLAGEPLKRELVESIFAATEAETVCNLYGPSETTTYSTWVAMGRGKGFEPHIGQPIANTQIYILDEWLKPTPVGVTGEIYIGGAGDARGYLNRPEMTAERFQPDGFSREPGGRVYKTGDLGRWLRGGNIEFLGRNDYQVKIRGFRIELGEIEARLSSHPEVREAVVEAQEGGEGGKRLVAYYTGEKVGVEDLRAHLLSGMPDYMAPAAYVHLERLPLTPNGKLDRRALPAPEGEAYVRRSYEVPEGETERKLARIWAETLKLERVGRNDNFFELGGHSLLVITVIEQMRREGMRADVRTFFTAPTLRALTETIKYSGDNEVEAPPNLIPAGCERITPEMLPLIELTQSEIDSIVSGTPGGAPNVQDIYPLATLQEGMLFHHLISAEGDAYLMWSLLAFDTRERVERFVEALQAVIDRHDILRTAVVWEGLPEPAQVVWREAPLSVEEQTLNPEDGDITRQLLTRFDPRRYRMNLSQAPLIRMMIAKDAVGQSWTGLLLYHHLVDDNTSQNLVMAEVQAHLEGRKEELAEPLPFRNFVAQSRLGIGREEYESFFREMLGDVDEPTAPFGLIDAQGDGSGIGEAWIEVETGLSNRLWERARMMGVSVASLCHLAWAMALARVSGRDDVVFGTVLFGRIYAGPGSDRAFGPFINTLPVRIRIGEQSVEESLRQTHETLGWLLRHEHAPLALAQRCSGVEAPTPLFSALLNYRHGGEADETEAESELKSPAWEGIELLGVEARTNYPLILNVDDVGRVLGLNVQAQSLINPERICAYMNTALERIVEALEQRPMAPVRDLDVFSSRERVQLLEEWNETRAEYPQKQCVHTLYEAQAGRTPETVAVVFGSEHVSYGELEKRANRLANHLRTVGVGIESRVGVCVDRSVEMVEAVLGALKAGGVCVPLDPGYPVERLRYMVRDAGVEWVVTVGEECEGLLEGSEAEFLRLDLDRECIEAEAATPPEVAVDPDNLLYVIYTSGSTGAPKGVALSHAALVNLICWDGTTLLPQSRMLQFSSLNFDASFHELFLTWASGGTIVLITLEQQRDPHLLSKEIRDNSVERLNLPAAVIDVVLEELTAVGWGAVRELISTAEQMQIAPRWWGKLEQEGCAVWNHYGPSESHVITAWQAWSGALGGLERPPIGKPIANCRTYVLDRGLQPAPVGVVGELYLGGIGIARGYLNRPEQTAERFAPDPHSRCGGERVYRTGDVARYLDDGNIEYLGRIDHQVKIRGYRVELGEVEVALRQQSGIEDAVVVMREGPSGDKRLVAYVVAEPGELVKVEELRSSLRERLPDYMIPSEWVEMESFPLTANGKINRRSLPSPETRTERGRSDPRTLVEEIVIGIWCEVLKVEKVGVDENFFELGGQSLLATRVASRLRKTTGVEIGVRGVFEEPTVRGVAGRIEEALRAGKKVEAPPLVKAPREGGRDVRAPLSFAQQRLWFIRQVESRRRGLQHSWSYDVGRCLGPRRAGEERQ